MERSWAVLNSIFMNNKGLSHTLKGRTPFFITVTKTLIIQITWNTILYHWHTPPATNYGKLLVLFFYKIFPASMFLSFFFWFAPNDSLRGNNNALTAPFHLLISIMSTWEIKEQVCPKKLFSLNNFLISGRIT